MSNQTEKTALETEIELAKGIEAGVINFDFGANQSQQGQTKPLPPIIKLEEGEQLLVFVDEIREEVGDYNSALVDCRTFGDIEFSINGHALLVQRIKDSWHDSDRLYIIRPIGKVGRSFDYYVSRLTGDPSEIWQNKAGEAEINRVEALVAQKINELPPR